MYLFVQFLLECFCFYCTNVRLSHSLLKATWFDLTWFFFANNFGLYINSQPKNQYGRLNTLLLLLVLYDKLAQTYCISMRTVMNAQNALCYICPQTSQNSPNRSKQAHTRHRRYRGHDDINLVLWYGNARRLVDSHPISPFTPRRPTLSLLLLPTMTAAAAAVAAAARDAALLLPSLDC